MQNRQEESSSTQPQLTQETLKIENLLLEDLELWVSLTGNFNLLEREIKKLTPDELFKKIMNIKIFDEPILHFLAIKNEINLIMLIIQALPIDKRTSALDSKDEDGNTVTFKLLASAHSNQIDARLKTILDLYPAPDRFAAFAIIENQNNETVLCLLNRHNVDDLKQLNRIFHCFSEIYLFNSDKNDLVHIFWVLHSTQRYNFGKKVSTCDLLLQNSLKLAFTHYDNFDITNIALLVQWYFLNPIKTSADNSLTIQYQKLKLILNKLSPNAGFDKITIAALIENNLEIISTIQMHLLEQSDHQEFKNIFRAYQTSIKKLNQFLHKCSYLDEDLQITKDQINKCKMQFHKMSLQIFDSLKESLNNRYVDNSFYKNIGNIYFDISLLCLNVTTAHFKAIYTKIDDKLKEQRPNQGLLADKILSIQPTTITTNNNNFLELVNQKRKLQLKYDLNLQMICVQINKNEIYSLRESILKKLNNSKNNIVIKDFNLLDALIFEMLCVYLDYNHSDYENLKKHKDVLLEAVIFAYRSFVIDEITSELIKKILNELKQKCQSIIEIAATNDAIKSKFSSMSKKIELASALTQVIEAHNKNVLNNLDDLTNEQIEAFQRIYRLIYFNKNYYNPSNVFLSITFGDRSSKEILNDIKQSSDSMVAKAIELALDHAENCNSRNKELVLQIYKFMDPKLTNFTVSPDLIDTIVKSLDGQPNKNGPQKKSDLIKQYAELICYIKMVTFEKSNQISNKAIFIARNAAINNLAERYNHDIDLKNKFNSLDLFIGKMLKFYVTYDPKKNPNRILNKELLYEDLRLAYQAILDTKQLDIDMLNKIEVELTSKCIQIRLDVARNHQQNSLLSRFVTQSSFDKTLKNELEEVSDDNSKSKTHLVTRIANKLKLFGKHEAIPLPESILDENNIISSQDDLTEFKDLINQLILTIPNKWQLALNTFMERASKFNEQEITQELEIKIEPGKRITREIALKNLGYFIQQANSGLENKITNFQDAIKELQQYLLQVIASSKQESIKSELASSLTTFINNKIKPKIKHEAMYNDIPRQEPVSNQMSPFSL